MKLFKESIIKPFVLLLFLILLFSCALQSGNLFRVKAEFDVAQTKKIFDEGNNIIKGVAYVKKTDGIVVTASKSEILLFPATGYSAERIKYTYGNINKGYFGIRDNQRYKRGDNLKGNKYEVRSLEFDPDYEMFYTCVRKVKADYLGHFQFEKIPDGDYYLIAPVIWEDKLISGGFLLPMPMGIYALQLIESPYQNGGILMLRVSVKGNETKTVEMTR